jgi:hypothetical protein
VQSDARLSPRLSGNESSPSGAADRGVAAITAELRLDEERVKAAAGERSDALTRDERAQQFKSRGDAPPTTTPTESGQSKAASRKATRRRSTYPTRIT